MSIITPSQAKGLSQKLISEIHKICPTHRIRLMEVCGTHTVSIFKHGIRTVLPTNIELISGPGCPVCVTSQSDIDAFIELTKQKDTIVASFGDLMRVPGSSSSLQKEQSNGRQIEIVYSTLDAIKLAQKYPQKKIVFLGVGFETTIPTIGASVLAAKRLNLTNYFVYCAHKLVPPALNTLMRIPQVQIDGFILPGHVSVIIGEDGYTNFHQKFQIPCAITGFDAIDILKGIYSLITQIKTQNPIVDNCYGHVVNKHGNLKALEIMFQVFETCDTDWRGIGTIAKSGLTFKNKFINFDAVHHFKLNNIPSSPPTGCQCGQILIGRIRPPECPLYQKACTPFSPIGPCMVSSEGACAAFHKYQRRF